MNVRAKRWKSDLTGELELWAQLGSKLSHTKAMHTAMHMLQNGERAVTICKDDCDIVHGLNSSNVRSKFGEATRDSGDRWELIVIGDIFNESCASQTRNPSLRNISRICFAEAIYQSHCYIARTAEMCTNNHDKLSTLFANNATPSAMASDVSPIRLVLVAKLRIVRRLWPRSAFEHRIRSRTCNAFWKAVGEVPSLVLVLVVSRLETLPMLSVDILSKLFCQNSVSFVCLECFSLRSYCTQSLKLEPNG